jgi:hypothetical protein
MWNCFQQESTIELNLGNISDAAWKEFFEYGRSSGSTDDAWATEKQWIEDNPKPLNEKSIPGSETIIVREPCKTISHVALYRTMVGICARSNTKLEKWSISSVDVRGFVRHFLILAFGGYFNHGSQTKLGGEIDVLGISLVSYIIYQATIGALSYETILYELQSSNRAYTGVTVADKLLG